MSRVVLHLLIFASASTATDTGITNNNREEPVYLLSFECDEDSIQCPDGLCVSNVWKCDGDEDEDECAVTDCKEQFVCNDALAETSTTPSCIHKSWLCDGEADWPDGSDEEGCYAKNNTCEENEFRCADGQCIYKTWQCDGDNDCTDGSDESNCRYECDKNTRFQCKTAHLCISKAWRCDGEPDCPDNSDEHDCSSVQISCASNEVKCKTGTQCISKEWVCDGDIDCSDESDELTCDGVPCKDDELRCKSGACCPRSDFCNGFEDCEDGSDEEECSATTVAPLKAPDTYDYNMEYTYAGTPGNNKEDCTATCGHIGVAISCFFAIALFSWLMAHFVWLFINRRFSFMCQVVPSNAYEELRNLEELVNAKHERAFDFAERLKVVNRAARRQYDEFRQLQEKANRLDEHNAVDALAGNKIQVLQELLNKSRKKFASSDAACSQLETVLRKKTERIRLLETEVRRSKDGVYAKDREVMAAISRHTSDSERWHQRESELTEELERQMRSRDEATQRLDEELTRNITLQETVEQLRQLVQELTEESDVLDRTSVSSVAVQATPRDEPAVSVSGTDADQTISGTLDLDALSSFRSDLSATLTSVPNGYDAVNTILKDLMDDCDLDGEELARSFGFASFSQFILSDAVSSWSACASRQGRLPTTPTFSRRKRSRMLTGRNSLERKRRCSTESRWKPVSSHFATVPCSKKVGRTATIEMEEISANLAQLEHVEQSFLCVICRERSIEIINGCGHGICERCNGKWMRRDPPNRFRPSNPDAPMTDAGPPMCASGCGNLITTQIRFYGNI